MKECKCKVCGSAAQLYDIVDFNHNAKVKDRLTEQRIAAIGEPVPYYSCNSCGFLFTNYFDDFKPEDWRKHVYNDFYAKLDPDYKFQRAANNAMLIYKIYEGDISKLSFIDYGGGNGNLAAYLKQLGADKAATFDPHDIKDEIDFKADLVTSFEVMEHTTDPWAAVFDMVSMVSNGGYVLFSTQLVPHDFNHMGLGWWYVCPRIGHISFYKPKTLQHLFAKHGMDVLSLNDGLHVAHRKGSVPEVIAKVLK